MPLLAIDAWEHASALEGFGPRFTRRIGTDDAPALRGNRPLDLHFDNDDDDVPF